MTVVESFPRYCWFSRDAIKFYGLRNFYRYQVVETISRQKELHLLTDEGWKLSLTRVVRSRQVLLSVSLQVHQCSTGPNRFCLTAHSPHSYCRLQSHFRSDKVKEQLKIYLFTSFQFRSSLFGFKTQHLKLSRFPPYVATKRHQWQSCLFL